MSGHTVDVNGATLAYDITGSGPAVVLISGGGTLGRRMWDGQMAALERRHTVLRYDIRGIGGSSPPDAPFSHSEDLHELLHALDLAPAVVVGLSFGGAIAIDLALDHRDDVKGLVLAAPGLSNEKDENLKPALAAADFARQHGMASLAEMIVNHPGVLASAAPDVRERVKAIYLDNAHVFESDYALVRLSQPTFPPAGDRLSAINQPTLLLVGNRDTDHVRDTVRRLSDAIRNARSVIVDRAGHLLNLDAPEIFNSEVTAFLDALDTPILQIFCERILPGCEERYNTIEDEIARLCVELKCPHPHLAMRPLTGPQEVWWLNQFESEADRTRVEAAYAQHGSLMAALDPLSKQKAAVTETPVNAYGRFRADLSRSTPWTLCGARFVIVGVTKRDQPEDAWVFDRDDGPRYLFACAAAREEAEPVAARMPDARVFAICPHWGYPAREWVMADPEFWESNPLLNRK